MSQVFLASELFHKSATHHRARLLWQLLNMRTAVVYKGAFTKLWHIEDLFTVQLFFGLERRIKIKTPQQQLPFWLVYSNAESRVETKRSTHGCYVWSPVVRFVFVLMRLYHRFHQKHAARMHGSSHEWTTAYAQSGLPAHKPPTKAELVMRTAFLHYHDTVGRACERFAAGSLLLFCQAVLLCCCTLHAEVHCRTKSATWARGPSTASFFFKSNYSSIEPRDVLEVFSPMRFIRTTCSGTEQTISLLRAATIKPIWIRVIRLHFGFFLGLAEGC